MTTRRDFILQTATSIATLSITVHAAQNPQSNGGSSVTKVPRGISAIRRDDTIRRYGGYGDCFHMSWATDDRQYLAVNDGIGWLEQPRGDWVDDNRLWVIEGGPLGATFRDLPGYPALTPTPFGKHEQPRYYALGTLALDGHLYQFLGTWNHALTRPDGSSYDDVRWRGAKLIYSRDSGRTWCNQDGSTPVVWEIWEQRSSRTTMFFEEPQAAFSAMSVLPMGRNYAKTVWPNVLIAIGVARKQPAYAIARRLDFSSKRYLVPEQPRAKAMARDLKTQERWARACTLRSRE